MAAIPDYVGNALQFDRSSRDTERMHDVQMQRMLQDLTQQATLFQQQQQQRRDQQQQLGQEALRYGDQSTQLSPAPAPSDNSFPQPPAPALGAGANTAPYIPTPSVAAQPMPLVPPGQSSSPLQSSGGGGAPPNLASLLGPKGQSYLSQQPQNAQPAALQVLLANLIGKGATARAPAPPGAGPAPAAPMQGPAPAPASGPAPTPNAATGGWQPSSGAGPALGGKPPAPAGAPASNALGAPPIGMGGIGGGSGMESRKIINPVQEIAKMVKDQHMTPDQAGRVGQAMLPVWEAQNKSVVDDFAKQSKIAADVMRYQDMLLRENRLSKPKEAAPLPIQRLLSLVHDPNTSPEDKAVYQDQIKRLNAPTTAQVNLGGVSSIVPEKDRAKNGPDYLATLTPSLANEIKGIDEGRINITSLPYRGNARQDFLEMVSQYDPNFDASQAPARVSTRRDFASGQAAKNITAINTAIGHLGTMDELANALGNNDVRKVNAVVNRVATELGQPQVNSFELAKNAVSDELMRVFRQVGASDAEASRWEKTFQSASSPQQLKAAMKTAVSLLGSRAQALNDQWINTMGTVTKAPEVIHSHSREVLQRMGVPDPLGGMTSGNSATNAASPPVNSKGWKLMTDKNGNRAYVSPDKKQFEAVQ